MKKPDVSDPGTKHVELDEAAVARIAESVRRQGPGLIRRSRQWAAAKRVGAVALVLMGIALAWQLTRTVPKNAPPRALLTCTQWAPAQGFDLGPRGQVAVEGSVAVVTAEPCRTVFDLTSGRITVHAENLGGGSLMVLSGTDQVLVRGTLFSVERTNDTTIVSTGDGVVEVVGRTRVKAGTRVRITADSVQSDSLEEAETWQMRSSVGLLQPANEPALKPPPARKVKRKPRSRPSGRKRSPKAQRPVPPTVDELIEMALRAKKRGDLEMARDHFRTAGGRPGPTAEAAWLGLARLELRARRPRAALAALDSRRTRFARGGLSLEAAWLRVRALDDAGQRVQAERTARNLIRQWPTSAQARLAKRWLEDKP